MTGPVLREQLLVTRSQPQPLAASQPRKSAESWGMHEQKITLGEMRDSGVGC